MLVVLGFTVLACLNVSDWYAQYQADGVISQMNSFYLDENSSERDECKRQALLYNEMLAKGRFAKGVKPYRSQLTFAEEPMMSYIEIPKISVRLPIYHGTEENTLMAGVGHLEGSSLPIGGNSVHCVLAGHSGMRNTRMFDDIRTLRAGDEFVIWTLGEPYAYQVFDVETVLPDEAARRVGIERSHDLVTLVTCTPYGVNTHRLLVHAQRCNYALENAEDRGPDAYVNSRSVPLLVALCASCAAAVAGYAGRRAKAAGRTKMK